MSCPAESFIGPSDTSSYPRSIAPGVVGWAPMEVLKWFPFKVAKVQSVAAMALRLGRQ